VVLNHLAAILFFSGPLFYCGLWMAIAPEGLTKVVDFGIQAIRAPRSQAIEIPRSTRAVIRWVGITLVVFAIAL